MLRKMTPEAFAGWYPSAQAGFASEQIRMGNWSPEEAEERARKTFDGYLPDGLETKDQFVSSIVANDTGEVVGHLWYGVLPVAGEPSAFVASLGIDAAHRRKGYATEALRSVEQEAKARGIHTVRLHVFGDNDAARALYARLGYREISVQMAKQLS